MAFSLVQRAMGHKRRETMGRYEQHQTVFNDADATLLERQMGLDEKRR